MKVPVVPAALIFLCSALYIIPATAQVLKGVVLKNEAGDKLRLAAQERFNINHWETGNLTRIQ